MARVHGRRGRLYVGLASDTVAAEPVAFLDKWAINFTTAKADVTCFGDNNLTYVSGLPDAQGTFNGFYDTSTAQLYTASQDGLARRFYLYPDITDGDYFFGTMLPDFSIAGDVGGAVAISGNWSAAGPVLKVAG